MNTAHDVRPTPSPLLSRAVGGGKCALVAAMAFLAVTSTTTAHATADPTDDDAVQELTSAPAGQARLDSLMARHDCSTTGLGADVIPGSSLVLRDDRVRHLSFDEGWAVYSGDQPGTLLAVCRATR